MGLTSRRRVAHSNTRFDLFFVVSICTELLFLDCAIVFFFQHLFQFVREVGTVLQLRLQNWKHGEDVDVK